MQLSDLSYDMTVISPGGLECEVLDIPSDIHDEVSYQAIGQVYPDSACDAFPEGTPIVRSMDAYTFCEWFSTGRLDKELQ